MIKDIWKNREKSHISLMKENNVLVMLPFSFPCSIFKKKSPLNAMYKLSQLASD